MEGRAIEGLSRGKTGAEYLGEGLEKMKAAKKSSTKSFSSGDRHCRKNATLALTLGKTPSLTCKSY
jgi:hypothetical protein